MQLIQRWIQLIQLWVQLITTKFSREFLPNTAISSCSYHYFPKNHVGLCRLRVGFMYDKYYIMSLYYMYLRRKYVGMYII